jgi:hypothetical protein
MLQLIMQPAVKYMVIRFLHTESTSAAEIHNKLCSVYSQNVMNKGTVRQWYGMFEDGWRNVHDEERSIQTAIYSE